MCIEPDVPDGFAGEVDTVAADLSEPGVAERLVAARPDIIFHLAAIVSGEAEADFDKGYRINLDGTRAAVRGRPARRHKRAYKPRLVFASSIAVFGAPFPDDDRRRVLHHAAHQLWHPEGDRRTAALRLFAARLLRRHRHSPADDLHPPGQAEQGGLGFLLQHPARAAGRPGSRAAGPDEVRHWIASPRAAVGFLLHAAPSTSNRSAPRRNLSMPGLSATVGEEIEALRRVAGDKAVKLIRREPDETIARIVAGWAPGFDPQRALALGFRAETSFDEIIRAHIDDELVAASGSKPDPR